MHKVRIRAKRLRYAAEAAEPAIGKEAKRTAESAEKLQTVLGELHDAVAAEDWLCHIAEDETISPSAAFVAGFLCREQQIRQERLRQKWRSPSKKLRRKKSRSLLSNGTVHCSH